MPNPAGVVDVEARWRPLSDQESINAQTFLDDAWWHLLTKRPTIEADIAAGTVLEPVVVRVLAMMVKRLLLNPELKSRESIDDYSYNRDQLVASGALTVTAEELADITPALARRHTRSVRLVVYGDR